MLVDDPDNQDVEYANFTSRKTPPQRLANDSDTDKIVENMEISQDSFEDTYNPPRLRHIPWKSIVLAVGLFLVGSILLIVGIIIFLGILSGDRRQGSPTLVS